MPSTFVRSVSTIPYPLTLIRIGPLPILFTTTNSDDTCGNPWAGVARFPLNRTTAATDEELEYTPVTVCKIRM
ncbi:hypothetical protein L1887_36367 [Cichorium endivia]|nr:hypothetical protein L1887_36367 [Cichorium endivia]